MKQQETVTETERIDLIRFFNLIYHNLSVALRRLGWLVIVLTLAGGAFMFARSAASYTPMYESKAVFTVSSGYTSSSDLSASSSYLDTEASANLSSVFPYIINSDLLTNLIKQDLGTPYINGSISAVSVAETNLFTLRVTSSNPDDAYAILNSVIDNYPQIASFISTNTSIDMIEQPVVATAPSNPFSWKMSVLKGAFAGFALSCLILLLFCLFRRTVQSIDELKQLMNTEFLGLLPCVTIKKRTKDTDNTISVLNDKIRDSFLESIRGIRVKLTDRENSPQVLMVTSTVPKEGVSTLAVNLALSLAMDHRRVILVDANLRQPGIRSYLNLTGDAVGLGDLLVRPDASVEAALTEVPGSTLRLLADSTAKPDALKRIASDELERIFDELRRQADYIIVDTPACGVMADAVAFSRVSDSVMYLVRQNTAPAAQILNSVQSLADTGIPFLGCILNSISTANEGYGYGYAGGYGYGYGYKYGYGSYASSEESRQEVKTEPVYGKRRGYGHRSSYAEGKYGKYGYGYSYGKYGYGNSQYGKYGYGDSDSYSHYGSENGKKHKRRKSKD